MFDFDELQDSEMNYYTANPWNESTEARHARHEANAWERQNQWAVGERDVPVGCAGIGGAGDSAASGAPTMCPVIGTADKISIMLAAYQNAEISKGGAPRIGRGKETCIQLENAVFMAPTILHPYHPDHPEVKSAPPAPAPKASKKKR